MSPWGPTCAWRRRPPMRCMRRWTGWPRGRGRSRPSSRPGTWARTRTRPGWRCSICRRHAWKGPPARGPAPATPGTASDGPVQRSLLDEQDLAEIPSPDYPGEGLVACRNPALAADRARKREELLAATERLLTPVIARVQAGRLTGAAEIGVAVGKV